MSAHQQSMIAYPVAKLYLYYGSKILWALTAHVMPVNCKFSACYENAGLFCLNLSPSKMGSYSQHYRYYQTH